MDGLAVAIYQSVAHVVAACPWKNDYMAFALRLTSELKRAIAPVKRVCLPVLAISSVYNLLLLSGSFFMLLVYDDVIPSRSVPSLVSLLLLVALAYSFQAVLDVVRGRMMVHVGSLFMRGVSDRVLDVLSRYELARGAMPNGTQIVRDVDTVRGYLSGPGLLAIVDLPWIVVYLLILSVFHWTIGLLSLGGVAVLVALILVNSRMTEPLALATMRSGARRLALADSTLRNAETLKALGMASARRREWHAVETEYLRANDRFCYISSGLSGSTKAFRMLLQSATLALGAFLVISDKATGGIIIAASILSARALAPVEQVIANWKGMIASRQALGDRYLWVSQMTPYKKAHIAVEAFNRLGVPALMVGDGEMFDHVAASAGPTVEVRRRLSFAELKQAYATCRALVFTPEEDFGIVPVEVNASGRPVIAYGRGGVRDSIVDGNWSLLRRTDTGLAERRFGPL